MQDLTFKVHQNDRYIRMCPIEVGPDQKQRMSADWAPYSSLGPIELGSAQARLYAQNLTGTFAFERPMLGEGTPSVNYVFQKLFREDGFGYYENTPYAQEMFPGGLTQKHFVAYDIDVRMEKCGSVCIHDKSVSWVYFLVGAAPVATVCISRS